MARVDVVVDGDKRGIEVDAAGAADTAVADVDLERTEEESRERDLDAAISGWKAVRVGGVIEMGREEVEVWKEI